ncbi:MAG: hypothetical protein ACFFA0_06365 [Promethearchaeota archaeon]
MTKMIQIIFYIVTYMALIALIFAVTFSLEFWNKELGIIEVRQVGGVLIMSSVIALVLELIIIILLFLYSDKLVK